MSFIRYTMMLAQLAFAARALLCNHHNALNVYKTERFDQHPLAKAMHALSKHFYN